MSRSRSARIAGHRVGRGAPFDALDTLTSCDPIRLETRDAVFTYRVLPIPGEVLGPGCSSMPRLPEPYDGVVGREIVAPTETAVLAAVPDRPELVPAVPASLLTLTTCHPRFSARQRLVLHAVLTETSPTTPAQERPA
ncbi:sortase domain-containing protein [Pseudonocardia halophobica]|uniref:sortase domain-containing protein n=1 Tax=Pseudonocardia halophobica TaxID=29401 RepID=UPI003D8EAA9E